MPKYILPLLGYDYDGLEPYFDAETMEIHHKKHHEAYVKGLNTLSSSVPESISLHELLSGLLKNDAIDENDKSILLKFGGGHYNHSLFWQFLSPKSSKEQISKILMERIEKDFGSFTTFVDSFNKAAVSVFGSGWAWWVYDRSSKSTKIMISKDQMNPIMEDSNLVCLLGLDVWEHAYYLKYRNQRASYIEAFWSVVNWEVVSRIYEERILNLLPLEVTNDGYIVFD